VRRPERGAALVEFALVSLVLYLLLAGAIEFGRLMVDANALQDVARVAARELAVAPISAGASFDDALTLDDVRRRIYDPACLVVDLADPAVVSDPDGFLAALPVVNRELRTLMITEPSRPNLLRYAGALLSDGTGAQCSAVGPGGQAAATGLTVAIPLINARDATGMETITWVNVVEEIRTAQGCPERGPFKLLPYDPNQDECGPDPNPVPDRGLAAVRINYPYQAATLSGFRPSSPSDTDPLPPNWSNPILADDGVESTNAPPGAPIDDDPSAVGAYAGPFGLGRQFALAGQTVRPFRKLISAQAIFRREVFQ
jgi:TadE-like protein